MDESYEGVIIQYLDCPVRVLIRLNLDDSKMLKQKLEENLAQDSGLSISIWNMRGAISQTHSKTQKDQIKTIAFGDKILGDTSKGYTGKWSHIEIVKPMSYIDTLKIFLDKIQNEII
jgi:hypothetical protein